jgi:tRNA (guanine9-N1)-methyltransferase
LKSDDNLFFKICCKQNEGLAKYVIDMQEESVVDLYPNDKLVYLTPDSPNALTEFDPEKIYVIGGLVDETTTKNVSLQFAGEKQISTGRLPIDEYFMPDKSKKEAVGTFKKVLTVNQVFDIILTWYRSKDWVKAISAGLPERTGLVQYSR